MVRASVDMNTTVLSSNVTCSCTVVTMITGLTPCPRISQVGIHITAAWFGAHLPCFQSNCESAASQAPAPALKKWCVHTNSVYHACIAVHIFAWALAWAPVTDALLPEQVNTSTRSLNKPSWSSYNQDPSLTTLSTSKNILRSRRTSVSTHTDVCISINPYAAWSAEVLSSTHIDRNTQIPIQKLPWPVRHALQMGSANLAQSRDPSRALLPLPTRGPKWENFLFHSFYLQPCFDLYREAKCEEVYVQISKTGIPKTGYAFPPPSPPFLLASSLWSIWI